MNVKETLKKKHQLENEISSFKMKKTDVSETGNINFDNQEHLNLPSCSKTVSSFYKRVPEIQRGPFQKSEKIVPFRNLNNLIDEVFQTEEPSLISEDEEDIISPKSTSSIEQYSIKVAQKLVDKELQIVPYEISEDEEITENYNKQQMEIGTIVPEINDSIICESSVNKEPKKIVTVVHQDASTLDESSENTCVEIEVRNVIRDLVDEVIEDDIPIPVVIPEIEKVIRKSSRIKRPVIPYSPPDWINVPKKKKPKKG